MRDKMGAQSRVTRALNGRRWSSTNRWLYIKKNKYSDSVTGTSDPNYVSQIKTVYDGKIQGCSIRQQTVIGFNDDMVGTAYKLADNTWWVDVKDWMKLPLETFENVENFKIIEY